MTGVQTCALPIYRVFGTPTSVDIAQVATALGWSSREVQNQAELAAALDSEVEVVVAKLPQGS